MPYPVNLIPWRRRQPNRGQPDMGRSTRRSPEQSEAQRPPISKADALLRTYNFMKEEGLPFAEAKRKVHERFNVNRTHGTVSRQVVRVRGIANNGGYPLELITEPEIDETEVINVNGVEYAFGSPESDMVIGVDEGVPGSDHTMCVVRAHNGSVVNTFRIARDGDDFVVKGEDESILGRGSSSEEVMEILQFLSANSAAESDRCMAMDSSGEWHEVYSYPDSDVSTDVDSDTVCDEESPKDASRFDIIDIE